MRTYAWGMTKGLRFGRRDSRKKVMMVLLNRKKYLFLLHSFLLPTKFSFNARIFPFRSIFESNHLFLRIKCVRLNFKNTFNF